MSTTPTSDQKAIFIGSRNSYTESGPSLFMDTMRLSRRRSELSLKERILTATWIYSLFFACYTLANRSVSVDSALNLTTPLDGLIPFAPEFVYPFYLLYGFIILPSFLIRTRDLFYRTATAFSVLIILSAIIFVLFPVVVPRPEWVPDSLAGQLVSSIYHMDRPLCGFPSLHVSASLLATLAVFRNSRIQGLIFFIMFLLTSAATLFIKQHVVLDAAGGIVMACLVDFIFINEKGLNIRSYIRAFRLMAGTAGHSGKGPLSTEVPRHECVTAEGTRYDLYEPSTPASKTFIVIHGLTLQGEKDQRLIAFSDKLASLGIRVAAISLSGLKQCRFEVADTQAISDLAGELSGRYGGKTGIIGFSFGAGLALVAAAAPAALHLIDPMILFGPYYDLKTVLAEIDLSQTRSPVTEEEWNNYVWIRLVDVYRHVDRLGLEEEVRQEIKKMLTHYCHEPSAAVKRGFYEKTLKHVHLKAADRDWIPESLAEALSPANKLQHIQSRVFLIHDYYDALIPPHHSRDIFAELKDHGDRKRHKLLITPLLSHVTPRTAFKVFDIFPLINIFTGIFE